MPLFDDEPAKKPTAAHVLGEDLTRLSEEELRHRISLLKAEIERLEASLRSKEESRRAASSFFRS